MAGVTPLSLHSEPHCIIMLARVRADLGSFGGGEGGVLRLMHIIIKGLEEAPIS